MSKTPSPALEIALAYYDAWRNRDHEDAMNYVADDVVVTDTPFGPLVGAAAAARLVAPHTAGRERSGAASSSRGRSQGQLTPRRADRLS